MEKDNHLENEKKNFITMMAIFLEGAILPQEQSEGRPAAPLKDIVASLLIMSYHGWSFRRAQSDIEDLYDRGILSFSPKKSTLHKYILNPKTEKTLIDLIEESASYFLNSQDSTLIIDSTWYQKYMNLCVAHTQRRKLAKLASLYKTRKIHCAILKNSKIVVWAKATAGHSYDTNFFEEMLRSVVEKQGFKIETIIGDKAYGTKKGYALCQELGIKNVFLDLKPHYIAKRGKSHAWKVAVTMFKNEPEKWHETTRFRVLIESFHSSIKRKGKNYIRNRKDTSQNCELLLKILWHNLTIISKFHNFIDSS